jgi:hypothetical protein
MGGSAIHLGNVGWNIFAGETQIYGTLTSF